MSRAMFFAIFASAAALFAAPGSTKAEEAKPVMTTETKAMPKPAKSGLLP
ncbi:alpha/beta hydrolase, partial [Mesorhizobium sp. M5C.F.Ca.IN.020.14.1.1]